MKNKSTLIVFTTIILGSIAAGITTGYFAHKFGSQALEVVQSPAENPAQKLAKDNPSTKKSSEGFKLIEEKDVLVEVYDSVYYQKKGKKKNKSSDKQSYQPEEDKLFAQEISPKSPQKPFTPIITKADGVVMEVTSMKEEQGSLLLSVKMKNNGRQTMNFLYSFLDVKDDQNRVISAISSGLPNQLPANGQNFSGEISIPLSLLNDAKEISLNLPNYPQQDLQLQISEIPVLP